MGAEFFGRYLLELGVVSRAQLAAAVDLQRERSPRLGDYAVRRGLIDAAQAERIAVVQRSKDLVFGDAAVELGLLAPEQVDELVAQQRRDHLYLGEAVVAKGFATKQAVDEALRRFLAEDRARAVDPLVAMQGTPAFVHAADYAELAVKLLLRTWNLRAKLAGVRVESEAIEGPVWGARVDVQMHEGVVGYVVALPPEVARDGARHVLGEEQPAEPDSREVLRELVNVIVGALVTKHSATGVRAELAPPRDVQLPHALADERAVRCSLMTPTAEVVLAATWTSR